MVRAHLLCRNGEGIKAIKVPVHECGSWDVPEDDARRLVGGMLHFHESKRTPSYFGGTVIDYKVVDTEHAHSKRVVFTVEATKDAYNVAWEGKDHILAHYSGVIE